MDATLEDALILAHGRTTDARVALHVEVVAERAHDLLNLLRELAGGREHERLALLLLVVELLQDAGAEGGRLTGTGLRLLDHVQALGEGHDAALLDRGGLLETVRVDAAEQVLVQVHRVEGLVHLGPVGDGHLAAGLLVLGQDRLHAAVVRLIVETTFARHILLVSTIGGRGGARSATRPEAERKRPNDNATVRVPKTMARVVGK